jgi:hypothetical protein
MGVNSEDAEEDAGQEEPGVPEPGDTADVAPDSVARLTEWPAMRAVIDMATSPAFRAGVEAARRQQQLAQELTSTPAFRAALESASRQQQLARELADSPAMGVMSELANSPALRFAAQNAATWQKNAELGIELVKQAADAIKSVVDQAWPGIVKAVSIASEALSQIYRGAAPPNWSTDESASLQRHLDAVKLAQEEGIPMAWVPDPETVRLLTCVPNDAPNRTAELRRILEDRIKIILDYCQDQLRNTADDPATPEHRRQMAEVALQSVHALRANLPAPAQSAAANLTDQLLRRLFTPIDGRYAYKATSARVTDLSTYITAFSWSSLAILRELATLMPVSKALTEWWPGQGTEPPGSFSRHATAHAIAEPTQVNTVNALIAVMLSVSLLCQETESDWVSLRTLVWNPTHETSD